MARTNSPRVIRRGPGGADEGIGPNVVNSHVLMARDREESSAISDRIWSARIACTDDAAYVAMEYPESPDTVFVYHRSGEETRLPVPTEFTEDLPECTQEVKLPSGDVLLDRPCPTWNQQLYPSLDGRGNIAVLRKSQGDRALRAPGSTRTAPWCSPRTPKGRRGARRTVVYSGAHRVSLHAIRRVSGVCVLNPSARGEVG